MSGVKRYDPWEHLVSRPDVELVLARLPVRCGGGAIRRYDGWTAIVIDIDLDRRHRSAALAHELVHLDWGEIRCGGMPASWHPVVTRREQAVEDEVARRLVPEGELRALCEALESCGECVDTRLVAEEFDVPLRIAERALTRVLDGTTRRKAS